MCGRAQHTQFVCCVWGIVVRRLQHCHFGFVRVALYFFALFFICTLLGWAKAFKHIISIAVHNTMGLTLILTYDLLVWACVCVCVCTYVCVRADVAIKTIACKDALGLKCWLFACQRVNYRSRIHEIPENKT